MPEADSAVTLRHLLVFAESRLVTAAQHIRFLVVAVVEMKQTRRRFPISSSTAARRLLQPRRSHVDDDVGCATHTLIIAPCRCSVLHFQGVAVYVVDLHDYYAHFQVARRVPATSSFSPKPPPRQYSYAPTRAAPSPLHSPVAFSVAVRARLLDFPLKILTRCAVVDLQV